ncbi:hypothetical protein ACHAXM_000496 [Skeletonema potamos]
MMKTSTQKNLQVRQNESKGKQANICVVETSHEHKRKQKDSNASQEQRSEEGSKLSASHVSSSTPVAKSSTLHSSSKQARAPRVQVIAASHDDTESASDDEKHTI